LDELEYRREREGRETITKQNTHRAIRRVSTTDGVRYIKWENETRLRYTPGSRSETSKDETLDGVKSH